MPTINKSMSVCILALHYDVSANKKKAALKKEPPFILLLKRVTSILDFAAFVFHRMSKPYHLVVSHQGRFAE